ncbi:hypothetical protein UFOVP457_67 [uncultured Caudovirales phage]|uniref:Uncharacterized protein n=1 Tax=uncultured Caudovirales phage TaxID=2100421 RepID=A0A6J5MH99_9CAUD|nr:hypothetical protein UFOVP457_67 [uncultured Caudovirales phage]
MSEEKNDTKFQTEIAWGVAKEQDHLIVRYDGKLLAGCPEGASTIFEWVEPLLHKVYALGKQDGYLEGLRDGAK